MDPGLWLDLLNSDWNDYRGSGKREDRLDNPLWLEKYLSRWKLDLAGVPPSRLAPRLRESGRCCGASPINMQPAKKPRPKTGTA